MRKLVISLLLASAAASPALADPTDDRAAARAERQQAREERQQARQEQSSRPERPQVQQRPQTLERPQVQERPIARQNFDRQNFDRQNSQRQNSQRQFIQRPNGDRPAARPQIDPGRNFDGQQRAQRIEQMQQRMRDNQAARAERRDLRQSARPPIVNRRPPVVSPVPRPGTQPPPPSYSRPPNAGSWNTSGWRQDNRYDWQDRRRHHHSLFHLGFYFDPFGWGYSPYQIGWRMWPSYYSSNYWLDDPWMYRLPYAPPGYRWIRYYDDAVLIDTWSGQVADVIYSFFW